MIVIEAALKLSVSVIGLAVILGRLCLYCFGMDCFSRVHL